MSGATQTPTGQRKPWKHGATIGKDGELRFSSVSALELFSRCPRRWKFAYGPLKLKDPPDKSKDRGDAGHAENARYLLTGERNHLSPLVISGLHMLPPPGPDLFVEYDIVPDLPDGKSGLANAKLRASGLPITGAIDLMHERPENYGVTDISDMRDEPGVLKFVDWKFPSSLNNAKQGHELVDTLQMAGYAKWGFEMFPQLERARLSHGYFPVRGTPRHVTALVTREQVEQTWKRADAIAVSMRDVAREPDPNKVDYNTRDCRAFNRDCPAKVAGVCRAQDQDLGLEYFVGGTSAEEMLVSVDRLIRPKDSPEMNPTPPQTPYQYPQTMQPVGVAPTAPAPTSIMAAMGAAPQVAPAHAVVPDARTVNPGQPVGYVPVAPAGLPTTPINSVPGLPMTTDIASEMSRLAGAMAPPAPAVPTLTPEQQQLEQVIAQIEACGIGKPAFAGPLAQAYSALMIAKGNTGYRLDAPGYSGTGELGKYTIQDPTQLPAVLAQVQKAVAERAIAGAPAQAPAAPAPAQVSPLPPAAAPAPTGPSAEELKAQKDAEKAAKKAAKDAEKAAKKAADDAAKAAAAQAPPPVAPAPATSEWPTTGGVGPMPPAPDPYLAGMQSAPPAYAPPPAPAAPPVAANAPAPQESVGIGPINFYVDCAIDGLPTRPFWEIVGQIEQVMTQQSGCANYRDVPDDNAFSRQKWKGVMTGLIQRMQIAPGNYTFDGAYGEVGNVVVEAMRTVVRRSGGVFVKGAR